jgi:hypothetical protein
MCDVALRALATVNLRKSLRGKEQQAESLALPGCRAPAKEISD